MMCLLSVRGSRGSRGRKKEGRKEGTNRCTKAERGNCTTGQVLGCLANNGGKKGEKEARVRATCSWL